MRLLGKFLTLTFVGFTIWSVAEIVTPITDSFGSDFNPPKKENISFRLSAYMSDNNDFEDFDKQINRFLINERIPGASVAIAKDGKLVYAKGYGYADKESKQVVEPYNMFRIASVSKLITACGIMHLVEQGAISLDSKVFGPTGILNDSIYLQYVDKRVEGITVLNLLNHSGGWTTRYGDQMFMPTVIAHDLKKPLPINQQDILKYVLGKRLHFNPGQASSYSNLGFMILGEVIAKVSDMSYEKYIQTNILYPLGIFDMQLGGSHLNERAELEVKYYEANTSVVVDDYANPNMKATRTYGGNDFKTLGAAGGWIASSTDLMKLLLSIDGYETVPDILLESSIQSMVVPVATGFSPLGWRGVDAHSWYRTGTLASTSSLMVRKDNGISYVVLLNGNNYKGPALAREIGNTIERGIPLVRNWPSYNLYEYDAAWASVQKRPRVIF